LFCAKRRIEAVLNYIKFSFARAAAQKGPRCKTEMFCSRRGGYAAFTAAFYYALVKEKRL